MTLEQQLQDRLAFMQVEPADQRRLGELRPIIMAELPAVLERFYAQIEKFPDARKFFSGPRQVDGAKSKQINHWDGITSGGLDAIYVENVTKVGEVHARIGLEPHWYIGGYAIVLDALIAKVLATRWPKNRFRRKGPTMEQVAAELGALVKVTLLDIDFTVSVYLEAAERSRLKSESQTLEKERETVVQSVGEAMTALANGALDYRMDGEFPPEYGKLRSDFNASMTKLQDTMRTVAASAQAIRSGAGEISTASDDLSRRTEQQAASLEETATALGEITATVRKTAEGAKQARAVVSTARESAEHSGHVVRQAVEAMSGIETSSREISQIIGVIDEIAFQTNLLALNAGVEAARAGDAGRGFAVVASEVRALAQRSAEAAKEIKRLISTSTRQVEQGVTFVGHTGESLSLILTKVTDIDEIVGEIATSAQQQAVGLEEVNTAVNQMDQVTQQNAAMVEQSTAASQALTQETGNLTKLIGEFQLGGGAAPSAAAFTELRPIPAARARPAVGRRGGAARKLAPAPEPVASWEEF